MKLLVHSTVQLLKFRNGLSNFIPHFSGHVITYPCETVLVKGATEGTVERPPGVGINFQSDQKFHRVHYINCLHTVIFVLLQVSPGFSGCCLLAMPQTTLLYLSVCLTPCKAFSFSFYICFESKVYAMLGCGLVVAAPNQSKIMNIS